MRKVLLLMLLAACTPPDNDKSREEILATDKAFSAYSKEHGMEEAFILYAAEEVIKPAEGQYPIIGKTALARSLADRSPNIQLTWEPVKADVSGDLGYTFGNWTLLQKGSGADSLHYGNYVSIWKRQADGKWQYVLDTGNGTPGPPQP